MHYNAPCLYPSSPLLVTILTLSPLLTPLRHLHVHSPTRTVVSKLHKQNLVLVACNSLAFGYSLELQQQLYCLQQNVALPFQLERMLHCQQQQLASLLLL